MAYKPVHIITNDENLEESIDHFPSLQDDIVAECWTCEGKYHLHYHFHWTVLPTYKLSPTKGGFVKHARRKRGCGTCYNKPWSHTCEECGLYYKFIWLSQEHHENTHKYLLKKIPEEDRPTHPGV